MTDTQKIRPSSLVVYGDCARRWAARHLRPMIADVGYTLQLERPTHVGAAVGSGVHAGAGYTMETKRHTGELGNAGEAEDRAVLELKQRMEEGVVWDATTGNLTTAQRQVARMVASYRTHLAPILSPLLVEERLEATVGPGWVLSGQPDQMTGSPDEVLRDLKTGTVQRANAAQYGAYFMLLQAHGYNPTEIREDFLRRVRMDKEQPPPIPAEITPAAASQEAWGIIEDIMASTTAFVDRASKGDRPAHTAFRANPGSQLCGPKWCAAWGTKFCTVHKKDQTQT